MTLYIRKLTSLNPTQYSTMPLNVALDRYTKYCQACLASEIINLKTFEQWRTTEI